LGFNSGVKLGKLEVSDVAIRGLCDKWRISRLAVFGSVLRSDFGPRSDVDFLVDFARDADWSLMDLVRAEEEFAAEIGRPVQLVERAGLLLSRNHIRKQAILESATVVHAA